LKIKLFDSYHCSRYNTSTGRLTPEMFHAVVSAIRNYLDASSHAITSSAFLSGGNTG
jgi:uracil-DNA glycosylase